MRDIRIACVITCSPVDRSTQIIDEMEKWIQTAKDQKAALICFPELNVTGYWNHSDISGAAQPVPGPASQQLSAIAAEKDIVILAGMAEKAPSGDIYASHLVLKPDGAIGVYRKLHVAPVERKVFMPGSTLPLFEAAGVKFGIQLCYDAHFPELSTQLALLGADLIFMPHASPRGTPKEKFNSWMRHLPARAYDNSLFIVACNQTGNNERGLNFPGIALVIGPSGKIVEKSVSGREGLLVADLKTSDLDRVRGHAMRYFLPSRSVLKTASNVASFRFPIAVRPS